MTDLSFVALACGLIIGLGAIGACIGIGLMASIVYMVSMVGTNTVLTSLIKSHQLHLLSR